MPTTGFYGFLWRFNAIAIAVAAVAAAGALGLFAVGSLAFLVFRHAEPDTNLIERGGDKSANLVLGMGSPIEDSSYVAFYLTRGYETGSFTPRSEEGGQIKNILLVRGDAATGQWLFADTNRDIEVFDPNQHWLPHVSPNGLVQPHVRQALWLGVKEDRSSTPDAKPHRSIALMVFSFADKKLHTIVSTIDNVRGLHQIADDKVLVVYEIGQKTMAATISTADFSVLATNELPQLAGGGAP